MALTGDEFCLPGGGFGDVLEFDFGELRNLPPVVIVRSLEAFHYEAHADAEFGKGEGACTDRIIGVAFLSLTISMVGIKDGEDRRFGYILNEEGSGHLEVKHHPVRV